MRITRQGVGFRLTRSGFVPAAGERAVRSVTLKPGIG